MRQEEARRVVNDGMTEESRVLGVGMSARAGWVKCMRARELQLCLDQDDQNACYVRPRLPALSSP